MAQLPVSNNSSNQVEGQRHSPYFEDGDIVVSATAEYKNEMRFFRVDKIFLARHSVIFRDMFVVGDSDPQMERYDGVPKVHLPDRAEDVATFLSAIYDLTTLPFSDFPCSKDAWLVQGVMRLAVKYEVEAIRKTILKRIESQWPQTLDEWERRYANRVRNHALLSSDTPEEEMEVYFPDPALAVRFALEFNCPNIFPAAIYELVSAYHPEASDHPTPYSISWEHAQSRCRPTDAIVQSCALAVLRDRQENDFYDTLLLLRCFHERVTGRCRDFCKHCRFGGKVESAIEEKAQAIWNSLSDYFDYFDPNYHDY